MLGLRASLPVRANPFSARTPDKVTIRLFSTATVPASTVVPTNPGVLGSSSLSSDANLPNQRRRQPPQQQLSGAWHFPLPLPLPPNFSCINHHCHLNPDPSSPSCSKTVIDRPSNIIDGSLTFIAPRSVVDNYPPRRNIHELSVATTEGDAQLRKSLSLPRTAVDHWRSGRSLGGRVLDSVPTASHAPTSSNPSHQTTVDASALANPRVNTVAAQPRYQGTHSTFSDPSPSHSIAAPPPTAAAATRYLPAGSGSGSGSGGRSGNLLRGPFSPQQYLQSPFRSRAGPSSSHRPRRLSAARLWNPTNSTPRLANPVRRRRPSTPPPPPVPLSHPTLDGTDAADPIGTGAGDYPLLTLPQQRQTRHSGSSRASLQVDRCGTSEKRVSLPRSVRHSYDEKRPANPSPATDEAGPSHQPPIEEQDTPKKLDKGKGKEIMAADESPTARFSKDLERGPDVLDPRVSNVSAGDGLGSGISSSNSSIMGDPEIQADVGEEWGPQHPCFPHMNPHVPVDSPEYQTTRIIRIRRDFLLKGDVAPAFSNLYPEILDPAGLPEQEFRRVVEKLNGELVPIYDPYNWRNIVDGAIGLITGWLWDDFGFTGIKSRLRKLEMWIEQWNKEMEKTVGSEEGTIAPKIVPLRRTGYMTLDIQIPDPEIARAPSTPGVSQHGPPMEEGVPATTA